MKTLLVTSAFFLTTSSFAQAYTVYPGCAVPVLKSSHHTFYIDPIHGSQNGDGSAAKPWHTLAEVLNTNSKLLSTMGHNSRTFKNGDSSLVAVNPSAPIKPGDVLVLETGNHGDVSILNSYNSDFVTVMAGPGQTPELSSLMLISSGKWLFQGLKLIGMKPTPPGTSQLVNVGRGDWIGMTSDIVLDSDYFASTDDTSSWKASDWNSKPDSYLVLSPNNASCVSITNNQFINGANAIAVGSSKTVVQGNTIRKMAYDGIDFYGSNQIIKQNKITDNVDNFATETLHADGIQGWSTVVGGVTTLNHDDLVDSNTIIKTGSGDVSHMQGISVFDGLWNGLKIINNVVVSNVYHGISVYGGSNVSIINNTVIGSDPKYMTWIYASKSKSGQTGSNIIVRNNICSNLNIGYPSVNFDHNIVDARIFTTDKSGKLTTTTKGNVGNSNKITAGILSGFMTATAATSSYDLRLRPNSPAKSSGTNIGAPLVDIINEPRSIPFDAGAYQNN